MLCDDIHLSSRLSTVNPHALDSWWPAGRFLAPSLTPKDFMTAELTARSAAKASRRQALLDAAARLFAERGFNGVRLEDLGAASGISGPGVYRHFSGKTAVLTELLLQVSHSLLDGALGVEAEAARQGATPQWALTELVRFQVDFALENRDVIAVQGREIRHLEPSARSEVVRLQREYIRVWAGQLESLHPGEDRDTAVFRAQAAFGLINSTPHSVRRGTADRGGRRELLAGMALAALLQGNKASAGSTEASRVVAQHPHSKSVSRL
jgi:AcrR family transcriptional regulator